MLHLLKLSDYLITEEEVFTKPYDLVKTSEGWKFKTDSGSVYVIEFASYVEDIDDIEFDPGSLLDPAELWNELKKTKQDLIVKHEVGFYKKGKFFWQKKTNLTNTGDAYRILATVIKAIDEYVKQRKNLKWLIFRTLTDTPSRVKLYDKLVNQFARNSGFDEVYKDIDGDTVTYNLKKNK